MQARTLFVGRQGGFKFVQAAALERLGHRAHGFHVRASEFHTALAVDDVQCISSLCKGSKQSEEGHGGRS